MNHDRTKLIDLVLCREALDACCHRPKSASQRLFLLGGIVLLCGTAVAIADERFPKALTTFVPVVDQPVFAGRGADSQAWDVRIRERGAILHDDDGVWKLWYTGYDGTRPGLKMLGLATSRDGIQWERQTDTAPLYRERWTEDVCVLKHQGLYYMFCEGFLDRAQWLTSPDGVKWTWQGLLDVRRTDGRPVDTGPLGTPTVWLEDGVWSLFYERRDAGIWLARSTDLKVWTNVSDEPVLVPGPAEYDRDLVAVNQIVKRAGLYFAVYHGASSERTPALWSTGLAVSNDLIHWDKYSGNPLRPIAENRSSGQLFPLPDGRFRLYTVHDQVMVYESAP
jgi:predicted GH43/DUF377 family glycosyl hydrolase